MTLGSLLLGEPDLRHWKLVLDGLLDAKKVNLAVGCPCTLPLQSHFCLFCVLGHCDSPVQLSALFLLSLVCLGAVSHCSY